MKELPDGRWGDIEQTGRAAEPSRAIRLGILAALTSVAVLGSACGGSETTNKAGDTQAIRQAVERRVDLTTSSTTSETAPSDGSRLGPELTAEDVVAIYRANGPDVGVTVDGVGKGDFIALETACDLLVAAVDYDEMLLVYRSFDVWFKSQLAEVGASSEYIASWDPEGMLDDLIDLGCTPSTSPEVTDLG